MLICLSLFSKAVTEKRVSPDNVFYINADDGSKALRSNERPPGPSLSLARDVFLAPEANHFLPEAWMVHDELAEEGERQGNGEYDAENRPRDRLTSGEPHGQQVLTNAHNEAYDNKFQQSFSAFTYPDHMASPYNDGAQSSVCGIKRLDASRPHGRGKAVQERS